MLFIVQIFPSHFLSMLNIISRLNKTLELVKIFATKPIFLPTFLFLRRRLIHSGVNFTLCVRFQITISENEKFSFLPMLFLYWLISSRIILYYKYLPYNDT